MAKLKFERLSAAWQGEASDFTPLLAQQIDALGDALGLDFTSLKTDTEVLTVGGRRIDIVAEEAEGSELVIENQYGRADHDHLTRGLAYAVARGARGLIVVAEEHRDEFRAVAQYLNEMAELDSDRGIAVWLVEAKAVSIEGSPWAPLFTTVVKPNSFVANVEDGKKSHGPIPSEDEYWKLYADPLLRQAAHEVVEKWVALGFRRRLGAGYVVFEAPGPAKSGRRSVIALYPDGRILVPFASYGGSNSGIEIPALSEPSFRAKADALFGFNGSEKQARTSPGWLTPPRVQELLAFCSEVAAAYAQVPTP